MTDCPSVPFWRSHDVAPARRIGKTMMAKRAAGICRR
jgi:hypothetical protein